MNQSLPKSFVEWRTMSRQYLASQTAPNQINWCNSSQSLFAPLLIPSMAPAPTQPVPDKVARSAVPKKFIALAKLVSYHRDSNKWHLLYELLWRLTHGEHDVMGNPADALVLQLHRMARQVSKDNHKMHAFVRFKKVEGHESEYFVAWHEPDHDILKLTAPFFMRRFGNFNWSIFTPKQSAHWDTKALSFREGKTLAEFQHHDAVDELWKQYYRSVFNPARVNPEMMVKEMPKRYWQSLPEASLIPDLIKQARSRTVTMIEQRPMVATPPETSSLKVLQEALQGCEACPIGKCATHVVPGEGNVSAQLMLVGEQPGDEEDKAGMPFIGPAGSVLNEILVETGITRADLFVTNAVKHFKWIPRGKRRLHQRPSGAEINACRPWLQRELEIVSPKLVVCLGATAAQTLVGKSIKIEATHLQVMQTPRHLLLVTYHPSAVLRAFDENQGATIKQRITETLRLAKNIVSEQATHQNMI